MKYVIRKIGGIMKQRNEVLWLHEMSYYNCHIMSLMDKVYIINCMFKMMHADTCIVCYSCTHGFRGFTNIYYIVSVIQYLEYNVNISSVTWDHAPLILLHVSVTTMTEFPWQTWTMRPCMDHVTMSLPQTSIYSELNLAKTTACAALTQF